MDDRKLVDKVIELLLSADSVEEFDEVIKMLVFDHGVPVLRRMIDDENRLRIGGH